MIVLVTGGKREDVYKLKIERFQTKKQAESYCDKINRKYKGCKYWYRAEIIKQSSFYEPTQDQLIRRDDYDLEC